MKHYCLASKTNQPIKLMLRIFLKTYHHCIENLYILLWKSIDPSLSLWFQASILILFSYWGKLTLYSLWIFNYFIVLLILTKDASIFQWQSFSSWALPYLEHLMQLVNPELLFTDTDSLCYLIKNNDYNWIICDNMNIFDYYKFLEAHPYYEVFNKDILGKFKNKSGGVDFIESVFLKSKMYSLL